MEPSSEPGFQRIKWRHRGHPAWHVGGLWRRSEKANGSGYGAVCSPWSWLACLVSLGMHRGGTHFDPSRLDKVTRGEIDQSVVATGKVQPITKIELKSKASGIVQNLYVDINQHVHKGQLLAQLDRQEITAEVEAQTRDAAGRGGQREKRPGQY